MLKYFKSVSEKQEFKEIVAALIFFYLLPIILLAYGVIPKEAQQVVLVLMSLIMVAYAISKPITLRELGFRKDNLGQALFLSGAFTALALLILFFGKTVGILEARYLGNSPWFYLYYIFLSVPLQEFVFRSLMFYELDKYFNKDWSKILISAVVFSFAHYAYRDISVLLITLFIGIIWGYVYLRRPNIWAVTASHCILGAATVYLGFV